MKRTNNEEYNIQILDCSKDLTARELIQLKALAGNGCKAIDAELETGDLLIDVGFYASMLIHNEKSKESKDYTKYIIGDLNGVYYQSSSESFWEAFSNIVLDLEAAGDTDPYTIKVSRGMSKNYQGKYFITCSLV